MTETPAVTAAVGATELQDLAAKLNDLLRLRTLPFGMKLFEELDEMNAVPRLRRVRGRAAS